MKKIPKKVVNYRKIYEQETGFPIPEGWDVHHIDGDRANNNILNLVALPSELHQQYHNVAKNECYYSNSGMKPEEEQMTDSEGGRFYDEAINELIKFQEVHRQCRKYVDVRNYQIGEERMHQLKGDLLREIIRRGGVK